MLTRDHRYGVAAVLALAGAAGFHLGATTHPGWQVAVETAQVVARIVDYPPGNPFFIYHLRLWTLIHQLLALLLRAGMSEVTLSIGLGGVLGMVSLQALAMIVYALTRNAAISIAAAVLIALRQLAEAGVTYPIYLYGSEHTYGVIGLSLLVLILGLFGSGWMRTAGFLLGAAPAVHPSLGVWLGVIVALACMWDVGAAWRDGRRALPWFAVGCAVTLASFAVQLLAIDHTPKADPATSFRYLSAFVSTWDVHRQPVPWPHPGVRRNAVALVGAIAWLTAWRRTLPDAAAWLLRGVAVSAILGLAVVGLTHVAPERLPAWLLIAMPGRLVNVDAMMLPALAIAAVVVTARSLRVPRPLALALHGVAMAAAVAALVIVWRQPAPRMPRQTIFVDRSNDPLWKIASESDGLLLTGGSLHLVQLRTRRPVLLDGGGLDGITYAVAAAPETERILREVYGIDYFHPPAEALRTGVVPRTANKRVWESYDLERWRAIKRAYSVSEVLTYNDWTLDLPVLAQNRELRLYSIP